MRCVSFGLLLASSLAPRAIAATYGLTDNHVGSDFLTSFTHEAIADPTNGRVNYVDQATALSLNLTYASGDTLILRSDDTTVLSPSGPGRNSVRILSTKTYTTHVAVYVLFMFPEMARDKRIYLTIPVALTCVTCHKDVELGPPLGKQMGTTGPMAEKSISIEGVNDQSPNSMTLHTGADCTMPATRTMTGSATGDNCDVNTDGNSGCGVQASTAQSYGPSFNAIGGGIYAMERTNDFINVWFWPRNVAGMPSDASSGANSIITDAWGTPTASFPNTDCDIGSHFDENNIIINLTFWYTAGGDWAGIDSIFNGAGCPGDCVGACLNFSIFGTVQLLTQRSTDFVNNNPSAFSEAFWDIAAVRVYQ
ncbi:hypothetical protein PHLCEN_2v12367 [Hermanssonia centrifuga]|uniref:Glycoside hydrolase family 16 protein n=1 Tax=Hermanssonia centrifuga TaxID=98765 RepID=A0A2R6NHG2_9APHY|nr:hypothetical protein PHLCEN_2v12367 [Hermanssonia centrifuga]